MKVRLARSSEAHALAKVPLRAGPAKAPQPRERVEPIAKAQTPHVRTGRPATAPDRPSESARHIDLSHVITGIRLKLIVAMNQV